MIKPSIEPQLYAVGGASFAMWWRENLKLNARSLFGQARGHGRGIHQELIMSIVTLPTELLLHIALIFVT